MEPAQSITVLQYLALIHQVSYTKVCKEVGLTPQQFSDWVKKRRPVPKERLQSLADYFNMDASLLIDEHHYLQDLTGEKKIDIQILFLKQSLEHSDEKAADKDEYREKLVRLQNEKELQILIDRFSAMVKEADTQTLRLCNAFLDQVKSRDLDTLLTILNIKEAE
ncbi:helix-turn-helix domain-containing protein [Paenibacillus sp. N3/727]|uniref:helix-turn-helix domain-containing protein n=1 Tax=Paenibacillus sp. N3/727 TaxID=2925845 RepID=UPI001F531269|nr:helix-turn-helix transcriptional regulator [Paenibacillus sp. N3/727]UNK17195.1 helix-turn-helix domain-containing protein [Paenibacillus sp. N3/727]